MTWNWMTSLTHPRISKLLWTGMLALGLSHPAPAAESTGETWKAFKLVEIKGKMEDPAQLRGWYVCVVKPPDGDSKEILLAGLPYQTRKSFDAYQAQQNPALAIQKLETELATRRNAYVSAVNSGSNDLVEVTGKKLELTKEQLDRLRTLSPNESKEEPFVINARPTGQAYGNLEIWDCSSQKELDAAFAQALKGRREQDARQAEARARLKTDQELADKNDPDGLFRMAERYYLGDRLAGIRRDTAKARVLYEKAAALGHPDAAIALKHLPPTNPPAK
jgi:hypothetical protein